MTPESPGPKAEKIPLVADQRKYGVGSKPPRDPRHPQATETTMSSA